MVECVSIFSGAGGLDVGAHQAGAKIIACVENDADAAQTLRLNAKTLGGEVFEKDIQDVDFHVWNSSEPNILIGGPPCQPFSKNGYWGLCCTNLGLSGLPLSPDGLMLRAQ